MRDLLTMPSDAPASEAWKALWALAIDVPYPSPDQTAGEWLEGLNLTSNQLKLIHYRAQEGDRK